MQVHKTNFKQEEIEEYGIGAGVLPYAIDEQGRVCVLLGRERYVQSWKGSCKWSAFEGSRQKNETIKQTAIREFLEESLHEVYPDLVRTAVQDDTHEMRIVLTILNHRSVKRYHCTYAVQIKWDPSLPTRFTTTRKRIEYIDQLNQEWENKRPLYIGKGSEIVIINDKEGGVHIESDAQSCIISAPWERDIQNERKLYTHISNERDVKHILQWESLRKKLCMSIIQHPCVCTRYGVHDTSILEGVFIQKDYLEKDQLRWWSLEELKLVLANKGEYNQQQFHQMYLQLH